MNPRIKTTERCHQAAHLLHVTAVSFRLEVLLALLPKEGATLLELAGAMDRRSGHVLPTLLALVRDGMVLAQACAGTPTVYRVDLANPALKLAQLALELAADERPTKEAA